MDRLFSLVCGVFSDFIEGKCDSMKLNCAVDAYSKIVASTPRSITVRVVGSVDRDIADSADDGDNVIKDEVSEDSSEDTDDSVSDEVSDDFENDDDIIQPSFTPDMSDDPRGETTSAPWFEDSVSDADVDESADDEDSQDEVDGFDESVDDEFVAADEQGDEL